MGEDPTIPILAAVDYAVDRRANPGSILLLGLRIAYTQGDIINLFYLVASYSVVGGPRFANYKRV